MSYRQVTCGSALKDRVGKASTHATDRYCLCLELLYRIFKEDKNRTEARNNRYPFTREYLVHLFSNGAIEVKYLGRCAWYLVVIIVSLTRLRAGIGKERVTDLALSPVPTVNQR